MFSIKDALRKTIVTVSALAVPTANYIVQWAISKSNSWSTVRSYLYYEKDKGPKQNSSGPFLYPKRVNKIDLEVYIMNKLDIQNEIIEVLLKHHLTFEEMKDVLSSAKYIIEKIQVPESVMFKAIDGTLTDKPTEVF